MIMPGIMMVGTTPIFFKIHITSELVQCIQREEYPAASMTVSAYVPALPRPSRCWSEGMRSLDNRRILVECYKAFKLFDVSVQLPSFVILVKRLIN